MHKSFWGDLGAEFRGVLRRWPVAVMGLTVVPGVLGAVFVPSADATALARIATALLSSAVALALISFVAMVIALIRVPLRDYRKRYLEVKLGQECIDCGKDILRSLHLKSVSVVDSSKVPGPLDENLARVGKVREEVDQCSDIDIQQMGARYSRFCAQTVYRCATALYEADHIGKGERDELRKAAPMLPASPTPEERLWVVVELLKLTTALSEIGIRLGGRVYSGSRGDWDRPPGP